MQIAEKNTDLHLHTNASDGAYTPVELVKKCYAAGLKYIAITDHDTTAGIKEAKKTAEKYNITLISGIEFSTKESGISVHILGYGIDIYNKELQKVLFEQQSLREKRMWAIIDKFAKVNIKLNPTAIINEADGGIIGRPHIAKVLVKMGIVENIETAFELYIGEGKPCYVKKEREMTPLEACNLIKEAGGVAILAHPVYYNLDSKIFEWTATGLLDGVEVYHSDHDLITQQHYEQLIKEIEKQQGIKLLRTGGSDFHHESYGRIQQPLGKTRIYDKYALQLLEKLKEC